MKFTLASVFIIAACGFAFGQTGQAAKSVQGSFCGNTPSDEFRRTYMTFTEVLTFRLDKDSKPLPVSSVSGGGVELRSVDECIATWKFEGYRPGSSFVIAAVWVDGLGWAKLQLRAPGSNAKIPGK